MSIDLPYHLREDALPLGECAACGRKTWDEAAVYTRCDLPRPDGSVCNGAIRRVAFPPKEDA